MASKQSTVDNLLDRLSGAGRVTARKMFGEFCIYLDDKVVALVADDLLYVKPTTAGRQLVPDAAEEPPYPGAKPCFLIPPERWESEKLCQLIKVTFAELPRAKPRKRKT
jgi:TfoX/Sxy family transcriptional regulator of competence genes